MNTDARKSNFLAALLGALVIAIPFGALAAAGVFDSDGSAGQVTTTAPESNADQERTTRARDATDVSALYERVSPGVVSVETQDPTRRGSGSGSGSGFVIDDEGHILTNEHVVSGAQSVRVRFSEGSPISARVVGSDPSSDLALLKIEPGDRELTPLPLGSSRELKVGEPAIAIGSPFRLEGTLTTGVISAVDRSIPATNNFTIDGAVQTDAAINPGNSGGPLLDAAGRVIGINAQIATSSGANAGVGFAIAIDTAKDILDDLKAGRTPERPYLGISTGDAPTAAGALVAQVVPGGPAVAAGLRAGDRIIAIGGSQVRRSTDVSSAISERDPGDEVDIRISRGGDERALTVTLGTRPTRGS